MRSEGPRLDAVAFGLHFVGAPLAAPARLPKSRVAKDPPCPYAVIPKRAWRGTRCFFWLYLNATVPSDQYGTSMGTVRSGGSPLFSGLSGLSGSGNQIDVEEIGDFGSSSPNSPGPFIGRKNITWHKLCVWPKWERYASFDII